MAAEQLTDRIAVASLLEGLDERVVLGVRER